MDEQALLEAIGKLIDEKLEKQLTSVRQDFTEQLTSVRQDFAAQLGPIRQDIADMKDDVQEIRDAQNYLIGWVDNLSKAVQSK